MRKFLLGVLLLLTCRSVSGQSTGYPATNLFPSYGADTGAVNVLTVPVILNGSCPASLVRGFHIFVTPNHNSTSTTPTVNVCALGAKTVIKQNGGAVASGDMVTTNDASLEYDGTNFELQNPQVSAGGSSSWSSLTNPGGNLTLSMSTDTSEFDYTSALAAAFKWANTTAATSGTAQPSPILNLCGQGWETGTPANTQDCLQVQQSIPNGANPVVVTIFTNNTSSTNGNSGFQFLGVSGAPTLYNGSGSGGSYALGSPGARVGNFNQGGLELGSGNRGVFFTNATNIDSGAIDSNISRLGASTLAVGNGSAQDDSGILRAGNACHPTSAITLTTGTPVTVCSWSLPAVAKTWGWSCSGIYSLTAGTLPTLKIEMNASQTPTSETGSANIDSTLTGTSTQATVTAAASGNQLILTGATNTQANAQFTTFGSVQASATAGTFSITADEGGSASPTGTVNVGTVCTLN